MTSGVFAQPPLTTIPFCPAALPAQRPVDWLRAQIPRKKLPHSPQSKRPAGSTVDHGARQPRAHMVHILSAWELPILKRSASLRWLTTRQSLSAPWERPFWDLRL